MKVDLLSINDNQSRILLFFNLLGNRTHFYNSLRKEICEVYFYEVLGENEKKGY
jgi:hypothetical protein